MIDVVSWLIRAPPEPEPERTVWSFFTSRYIHTLVFQIILVNRIAAIVAPRHPRPLKFLVRVILRLPLVVSLALSTLALWEAFVHPEEVTPAKLDFTFYSFFLFQCATYSVDVFSNALEVGPFLTESPPESPNLFEWAISYHTGLLRSSKDDGNDSSFPGPLVAVALLQSVQLLTQNVLALFGVWRPYKLIPTTFFGLLDIAHFVLVVYLHPGQKGNYPVLIYLSRFPELCILCITLIVAFLHGATVLVTEGDVRTPAHVLWAPRISLNEDFNLVLFKLGCACLEATQNIGLTHELEPIRLPPDLAFASSSVGSVHDSGFAVNDHFRTPDGDEVTNDGTMASPGRRRVKGVFRLWVACFRMALRIMRIMGSLLLPRRLQWWARSQSAQLGPNANGEKVGMADDDPTDNEYVPFEEAVESDDSDDEDDEGADGSDDAAAEDLLPEIIQLVRDAHENEDDLDQMLELTTLVKEDRVLTRNQRRHWERYYGFGENVEQLWGIAQMRRRATSAATTPSSSPGRYAAADVSESERDAGEYISAFRVCVVCQTEARQIVLRPCGCLLVTTYQPILPVFQRNVHAADEKLKTGAFFHSGLTFSSNLSSHSRSTITICARHLSSPPAPQNDSSASPRLSQHTGNLPSLDRRPVSLSPSTLPTSSAIIRQSIRQSSSAASIPPSWSPGQAGSSLFPRWLTGSRAEEEVVTWPQAVAAAESLVHPKGGSIINPRELVGKDLALLTENIRKLLGSGHPVLNTISNYYFDQQGKHIRPLIVLLMSQATSIAPKNPQIKHLDGDAIDAPISRSSEITFAKKHVVDGSSTEGISPAQRRLAEITEMIHTASLLHDDVIDNSMTRRSKPSANAQFGNKMAILAGDFLLARASVALARLRNVEVVELLATVISNLVEGEFMQLRNSQGTGGGFIGSNQRPLTKFEYYMEKTYLKTASLIAKSCRAAAVLGGCTAEVGDIAYAYGRNIGLAFQLVDDLLDFVVSADDLGKPSNADLKLGLATAPVLYAAEQYSDLWPLIERKFEGEGDVEKARQLVHQSNGIQLTRDLAKSYAQNAVDAISQLPPSKAQDVLIQLTESVLSRRK
ncbi:coq1 putative hexaprenyl diphosphate synthase [Quaeritorhiza haematococci]|nr:coq1 putative hexaprenyl diphosphate synthase [Quaeritorhiza haematococci]